MKYYKIDKKPYLQIGLKLYQKLLGHDLKEIPYEDVLLEVYAMCTLSNGDETLCDSYSPPLLPEFYDITLRYYGDNGEIIIVEEIEDLTLTQACDHSLYLESKYDTLASWI